MKNKSLIFLLLLIIILAVILFTSFYDFFYMEVNKKIIPSYLFAFICIESAFIIISFLIIIFSPIYNYIHTKFIEFKFSKNINFEYYRDIIKNYSIGTLYICYNKKANYKDILVSTLLRLEIEKKIVLTDEGISVISKENLSQSETNIIKSLTGSPIYSKQNVARKLKEDSNYDFRISDLHAVKSPFFTIYILFISFILYFLNFLLVFCLEEKLVFAIILIGLLIIIGLLSFDFSSNPYYIKNEKGLEIQYNLIGLKKYLKDYSYISDKSVAEIALWDYYIIYGIFFNLKGLLNEDAKKMYMKYYNLLENKL